MSEFSGSEIEVLDEQNNLISGGGKKPLDKKDMIKNVAIAFLSVMLILTFFSNTIMNYSLPQVATQQISRGSISPQIRGTGTVSAEDPYSVTVKETRKISGVAVKEGAHVEIGDVLYYLEDKESEELKNAKEKLDDLELSYKKALFSGDIPDEVISRVRSGSTITFDSYQLKIKELTDNYEIAKKNLEDLQDAKEYLAYLQKADKLQHTYDDKTYQYTDAELAYQKAIQQNPGRIEELERIVIENTRNQAQLETAANQLDTSYEGKINAIDRQITRAQVAFDEAEKKKTDGTKSIQAEIDLCDTRDKITDQKKKIAELEEASVGASVKTPVAGIVSSLSKAAGESTSADETVAVIQIDGKDMTTSFSVTNAQAQKLKVGDAAKPQNAWMFSSDFKATLVSIKNDKTDPANKKLLTFKIESTEVTPGQNLALAIGERSIDYDMVVPNSAISTGNTGKFVRVVNSKSSPLGNRYIASNVDVVVVASDDNYSAITAALSGDEFVITTSNKPVKAGEQVRLANE